MKLPTQVLCVDNDIETAEAFAELIERQTRLTTTALADPDEVLKFLESTPVAVLVLDQKMPAMDGTELYARALKIRPGVKAVMLSGVAEREDVSSALSLGYIADVRKDTLDKLSPAVLKAFLAHFKASNSSLPKPVFLERRGFPIPLTPRIEYYIDSVEEVSTPFVPDHEWQLLVQINAGQSIEVEETVQVTKEFVIENTFESGAESGGGLQFGEIIKVEGALKAFLKSSIKSVSKQSSARTVRRKETFTLPAEPVDPALNAVMARGIYVGGEFVRVRIGLIKRFLPFADEGYCWLDTVIHTGRFVGRQLDTLRNGERAERLTGYF